MSNKPITTGQLYTFLLAMFHLRNQDYELRVYSAIVKPTLLYGSETWTLQSRHMKKLQATEMRYLRKGVEDVMRMDRMSSDDIRGIETEAGRHLYIV